MSYDKPLSYSGMSLYKKCPKLWHDCYILGNRTSAGPAAERGTILHTKLEDYFNGKGPYPSADKCLKPWQKYMEDLKAKGLRAEGEVAVNRKWERVAYDDPKAWFRGKMDGDHDANIYDWKSGKIYDNHKDQGEAYAALSSPDHPECDFNVRFVYLDIPLHVAEWDVSIAMVREIKERTDSDIQVIRLDSTWHPTPGDNCKWCQLSWRRGGKCEAAP